MSASDSLLRLVYYDWFVLGSNQELKVRTNHIKESLNADLLY